MNTENDVILTETRGGVTFVWHCEPPAEGSTYLVLEDDWDFLRRHGNLVPDSEWRGFAEEPESDTVRHVFRWEATAQNPELSVETR